MSDGEKFAELEARIIALESQSSRMKKNETWERVKAMVEDAIPGQNDTRIVQRRYRVTEAISAILRSRYSIHNIARLPEDKTDEIYELSKELLAVATGNTITQ